MRIIRADSQEFRDFFQKLRQRGTAFTPELLGAVAQIIQDVRLGGDEALCEYTKRFDGADPAVTGLEASRDEIKEAAALLAAEDREVLELAARRIEKYHLYQSAAGYVINERDGVELGQKLIPLERAGIYAPGGKASYPSTLLMAAIPARIAGVKEIILTSPARDGRLNPLIAAAAEIAGVSRIFKVGGAQAIAALAYGTQSVPRVDIIVGPGNAYVAAAKKLVFGQVAIDMIAGPSEVAIIADEGAEPSFVAADLLAQAEHDEMAAAVLFTVSETLAGRVVNEINKQLTVLPKKDIIDASLSQYGAVIITKDLELAMELVNLFAPEHLELMVEDPSFWVERVRSAGSVFLGNYTPEALGDYTAGANHILPTEGTARFSSPLGVYDFYKRMSVLSFSPQAFIRLAPPTERFARMEGLDAHANSIRVRRSRGNNR
jgi:histidinol dehydrogenase